MLVKFYIVKDDGLGRWLEQAMIRKAREGVPVYFLFDEVFKLAVRAARLTAPVQ